MTKKDYIRAAEKIRGMWKAVKGDKDLESEVQTTEDTFVEFFAEDNPRFNENRFRSACKP